MRARIVILVAAVVISAGLLLGGYLLANNTSTNTALLGRINAERARNVRAACEGQNERHDNTIRQLDRLIAQAPPSRRARANAGRESTVLLIEALAPRRDCAALVRASVDQP